MLLLTTSAPAWSQSHSSDSLERPIRLPSTLTTAQFEPENAPTHDDLPDRLTMPENATELPANRLSAPSGIRPNEREFHDRSDPAVANALATLSPNEKNAVTPIPSYVPVSNSAHRIVRYEVPLEDRQLHSRFLAHGVEGQLIEVVDHSHHDSFSDRVRSFLSPMASRTDAKKIRVVRYEVPADDISFHAELTELDGQILEPWMLRPPEVRFFQPKARVFMDLKQSNDGEFDLFNDGALLASLDIVELYFPMPLISERFAEAFGRPGRLASLGWRFGGTVGLGITTALNNGGTENGSAPVSTLASGLRYEFPLGRPSRELIDTGDTRLDQRTRVGIEFGVQGGVSTRESLRDSTDVGLYFGILVNTPWGV